MSVIDLRSDTVTRPDAAMREAMARAEVGDDVYGEDPTLNRLQEMAAERLGKEVALFVPSGTMGNQVALRAHTEPGDAAIVGRDVHMVLYESGAAAAISGVQLTQVGEGGLFDGDDVRAHVFPPDDHYPRTRLVCVENTHNKSGGRIFGLDALRSVSESARERGLATHMDGARLFNAEVATGVPAARLVEGFDTVSFCLSKGLGAPVGSLVVGPRSLLARLHRARKMLGGGMRQAGILAAAGIHALEHNVKRLADDHANAQRLAQGLSQIEGLELATPPETNIVLFRAPDPPALSARLRERGVLMNPMSATELRAVTHLDVSAAEIDTALEILRAEIPMTTTTLAAPEGLRFECTQCGKCCTARGDYAYVYLNDDEVETLADFLSLTPRAFRDKHTFEDEEGWTQLLFEGDRCTFLDDDTDTCTVYPARPTQCRTFPFWRSMVKDGRWTPQARLLCEGVDRGPIIPAESIEARMVEMEESEED